LKVKKNIDTQKRFASRVGHVILGSGS